MDRKVLTIFWNTVCAVLFLIGLVSIPEDVDRWKELLRGWLPLFLGYAPISWAFMIVGGSGLIYWHFPLLVKLYWRLTGIGKSSQFQSFHPRLLEIAILVEDVEQEDSAETKIRVREALGILRSEFGIKPYPLSISNVDSPNEWKRDRRDFFRHMEKMSQKGDLKGARKYAESLQAKRRLS